MTELEKLLEEDTEVKEEVGDVSAECESLAILATLGTTKDYLGKNMTLADVHRLSKEDVRNYYKIYQMANGQQLYNTLVRGSLGIISKVISHVIPLDSPESLANDLQEDKLVQRELSSFAGYLVLKGGRLVALASGLLQVAKHVDLNKIQKESNEKEVESNQNPETRETN